MELSHFPYFPLKNRRPIRTAGSSYHAKVPCALHQPSIGFSQLVMTISSLVYNRASITSSFTEPGYENEKDSQQEKKRNIVHNPSTTREFQPTLLRRALTTPLKQFATVFSLVLHLS